MHPAQATPLLTTANDYTLFVIVISISFLLMAVFFIVLIINIYSQRVRNQENLLDAIYSTQENERNRIAEDLHDNIGANLSAMKLRLDAIREDAHDDAMATMASDSMQLLDDIISSLRNIIRNQSSVYLINNGFESELLRFKSYFSNHNKINMEVSLPDILPDLNNNFGINLFRIIQEMVTNSVKHSSCNAIKIHIAYQDSILKLHYKDNGHGFNPLELQENGMGLFNIDSRTRLFKGTYKLDSQPGGETNYRFDFLMDKSKDN